MPFEELDIVSASRNDMPASVCLSRYRGGRPHFVITLTSQFAAACKIADSKKFKLLLGTGEQLGLARLTPAADGKLCVKVRKLGGAGFRCGYIARFGAEARPKEYCNAEQLDDGSIEIALPKWAETRTAPSPAAKPVIVTEQSRQHTEHLDRRRRLGVG